MAISRKPISIKDVAFRTSFGLGPEKTENQGPNRERKAGRWGESMVRRGALERCETGANPLETREKRKPVTPENDPRETGLSFLNGGGGENRTLVWKPSSKESTYLAASLRVSPAHRCRSDEELCANYARRVSPPDSDLHPAASLKSRRSTSHPQAGCERTGSRLAFYN